MAVIRLQIDLHSEKNWSALKKLASDRSFAAKVGEFAAHSLAASLDEASDVKATGTMSHKHDVDDGYACSVCVDIASIILRS